MSMLGVVLDPATVVVAVDPGKVMNRVWVSDGIGLLEKPVSLPVERSGIESLEAMLAGLGPAEEPPRQRAGRVIPALLMLPWVVERA